MSSEPRPKILWERPHYRKNILTGEWLLVSPQRARRPWQGKVEALPEEGQPDYDPNCYLCPGNSRAGGKRNPNYRSTFVFENDFSALMPDTQPVEWTGDHLLQARGEPGICRVVCFSPRHDLSLAELSFPQVRRVVDTWVDQFRELGSLPIINYVQIFENKGQMMGCSNPHPHGQIWAQKTIPGEPFNEWQQQERYFQRTGSCLLCDYLALEERLRERQVLENDRFSVLVPFWAIWPFETLILSKRHLGSFLQLDEADKEGLADILLRLTIRYDNLFQVSFPYSAGFHPSPTDGQEHGEWHFHMHFYPPLLRSATIKKFMVGYEMLANPQRDITAERSAEILRLLSERHYKQDR